MAHSKAVLPHGFERVVGVHDGVDQVVHNDEPSGGGCELRKGIPGVQQDG